MPTRSYARRLRWLASAALALAPFAGGDIGTAIAAAAVDDSAIPAAQPVSPPTYHRDVAPIVFANCTTCHRPGEAGPFALRTYADVKRRATQIADVTGRRLMPPWKPVGGHVPFVGERRLTDAQVATLRAWADAGAPEGDAKDAPAMPAFPTGWQLGEPDLVVKMPEPYSVPADGPDIYRSFVLPVAVPAGKYVRAAEFRPGNRAVVHHAVLTTMKRAEIARHLSAEPAGSGPGFKSGLNAPGDRLPGSPGIWVPGKDPLPLPDGYAMPWPAGCDLLVQLHLHPDGKPETEQSSVGLYLTDEKPRDALRPLVQMNRQVDIPPADNRYILSKSTTLKQSAEVVGLFPHMHLLGRTCRTTATTPDGKQVVLLNIDDWDFRWQGYYQCKEPVRLPAGTKVESVWTFDNSAENPAQPSKPPRRVTFGEQTTDEMGVVILDVIPAAATKVQAGR